MTTRRPIAPAFSIRTRSRSASVLAAALAMMSASVAMGQGGSGGVISVTPGQPRVVVRNNTQTGVPAVNTAAAKQRLDRYSAALGLDDAQKSAAKDLYDAFQKTNTAAATKTRDAMKDAQESIHDGDMKVFEEKTQSAMKAQREATKAAEKQFLDDLRTLLTPRQQENWPVFERVRRREQLMASFGGVSGASVDLLKVVESIGLPPEQKTKLAEPFAAYDLDLDRLLLERKRLNDEMQESQNERAVPGAGGRLGRDPEKMMKISDRQRAVDIQVRDLNDKSARTMADLLDEPWNQKLLDRVQQQSFRSIYRESNVARKLKQAGKLESLTARQKQQIRQLAERYQRDAKPANDAWAAARRKAETAGTADNFPVVVMPNSAGLTPQEDADLVSARNARRDLDRAIRDEMEKVLTPEQLAELPDPSQGGGGFGHAVRVQAFGNDDGDMMVFASDDVGDMHMDMGDEMEGGEGGGVFIMRTVEVVAPKPGEQGQQGGQPQTAPKDEPKK